jgi:predicted phosphodiesterase
MIELRKGEGERNMVKVVLTGDWHLGIRGVSVESVKKIVSLWFTGKPVILMGDLIDCGIDRGMQYDNILKPQEQIDLLTEILEPLNILGYVVGNHERRFYKGTGIDILKTILKKDQSRLIEIDGKRIYVSHGVSAAQNPLLEFEKFLRFIDADVYGLGHNHELLYKPSLYSGKLRYFVRTGTFLSSTRYTEERGYAPKIRGWVEYDTCKHKITLYGLINGEVVRRL